MLDSRVHSFLAVCKHLSYTRAAQEMNLTQPAITQHIQYLQDRYQVKFFCREGNRLDLTPEGEYFRKVALTMAQDEKKLRFDLQALQSERYLIRFGMTRALQDPTLPHRLVSYLNQYLDREVYMVNQDTKTLLQGLDDGTLHFVITDGYFSTSEYDHLPWSTEECICVCSSKHPLANKSEVDFKFLLPENLILCLNGSGMYSLFIRILEDRNLRLSDFQRILEIQDMDMFKQLLLENCGIGFLYRSNVLKELRDGTLAEVHLKDYQVHHEINFVWRKGSIHSSLFQLMYEFLHP